MTCSTIHMYLCMYVHVRKKSIQCFPIIWQINQHFHKYFDVSLLQNSNTNHADFKIDFFLYIIYTCINIIDTTV